jgi:RNA polymerase sigma factor (sigma-70 family)
MAPLLAQRSTQRAFERVYKTHARDVYRYALAVLGNQADAEDVTQTTFLNAYRAFERGERPRAPRNWLIAIAHNVCRQRFRQAARRPNEVAFEEDLAEAIVPSEDAPTAADLQRALGQLAFNQRAALVMRELEGRSYAEIAEALELSVSAVETLIFRARRALREQLEGGLSCSEAELAISRQADGTLPRSERGALRAHLRECPDCARLARSQRAQRGAWKSLGAVPVPTSLGSLGSLLGGGGAGAGVAVAAKAAAVVASVAVVGGGGYALERHPGFLPGGGHTATPAATEKQTAPAAASAPLPRAIVAAPPTAATPARHRGHAAAAASGRAAPAATRTTPASAGSPPASHPTHPTHPTAPTHPAAGAHPAHPARPAQANSHSAHPAAKQPGSKTTAATKKKAAAKKKAAPKKHGKQKHAPAAAPAAPGTTPSASTTAQTQGRAPHDHAHAKP